MNSFAGGGSIPGGDILQALMCQMHMSQTKLENPPFHHTCVKDLATIDTTKVARLCSSKDELMAFAAECLVEFKQEYPNALFGSVHMVPHFWAGIALSTIQNARTNNISFPNGCCTFDHCPINNYYEIVLKNVTAVRVE
jgi:hypothetical protein